MSKPRVVDGHVHFWDPSLLRYPWLDQEPSLARSFLPRDFAALATGEVDAVLFVEAGCEPAKSPREIQWVNRLAAAEPRIIGIVSYLDLLDAPARAAGLLRLASEERVVGVRYNIQRHEPGFALQTEFVRGVQAIGDRDIPFDLCITGDQVAEVVELVERCPDTRFVLDHCGKPAIRDDAFSPWAEPIELLARHERVSCKLSGLLTEAREDQRNAPGLQRYAEHVLSVFGAARLMYGSDWPVCTLGGGAERWRAITDAFTEGWSESDRAGFYADNALAFYGLSLPARV